MEHMPDFTWRNHKVESRAHVSVYLVLAAIQAWWLCMKPRAGPESGMFSELV